MKRVTNLVTTVIPVFNRPAMLQQAVSSVLAQTHPNLEVLIVDDGSTDETPEVAAEMARKSEGAIRLLRQENAGPGPAREHGRRFAQGEFVQYLDSDDRLTPNKFSDQIEALRRSPECGIAYGRTRLLDQRGAVLAATYKWTDRDFETLFPGLLVDRWWCTHTPLYRSEVTDQIGAWSSLRWSQDWEYDSRLGALGVRLVNCGSHVSDHVHHDGIRQTSDADWSTDPVRLRNRVDLLTAIWKGAEAAGVSGAAPERQHFARWCFSIGRQCSTQGLRSAANLCFDLAETAAGKKGAGRRGVAFYRSLFNALGANAVRGVDRLGRILRRTPGASTMDQSFASNR